MASSTTVELQTKRGRYNSAAQGLGAIADSLNKNLEDFGHVVAREMREYINTQLRELSTLHSGPITGDDRLAKRTGALVRALNRGGLVTGSKLSNVRGQISLPGKYSIHEYGGTIKANASKYMFVPLPAALTANGKPKKMGPRQWRNTFIAESRKGNLLLFQRQGRKLVPLYVLKSKVRIRPRLGLADTMRRGVPAFADKALEALFDAITTP